MASNQQAQAPVQEYIRVSPDGKFLEIRRHIGTGTPSTSGKSNIVVSTGGFTPIADSPVRVNLTAIIKV